MDVWFQLKILEETPTCGAMAVANLFPKKRGEKQKGNKIAKQPQESRLGSRHVAEVIGFLKSWPSLQCKHISGQGITTTCASCIRMGK